LSVTGCQNVVHLVYFLIDVSLRLQY